MLSTLLLYKPRLWRWPSTSGYDAARRSAFALFAITICALTTSATAPAAVPAPTPPPPENLNVRIIGTASFQNKQTALIQDIITKTESFYRVGDPIYGYHITEITAEGMAVEKSGQRYYLAYQPSFLRATPEPTKKGAVATPTGTQIASAVSPSLYLPSTGATASAPNFYSESGSKPTQWYAMVPGQVEEGQPTAPSTETGGRFSLPLAAYKRLSSGFGYRDHPLGGGTKMHKGVDLAANQGTKILAADNGTVIWSGWRGGYGYCIIIDHHNGYTTTYGHCSKLVADVGDNVRRGDYIADVGSTGASTGPHLHFEVRQHDQPIDPVTFFPAQFFKVK